MNKEQTQRKFFTCPHCGRLGDREHAVIVDGTSYCIVYGEHLLSQRAAEQVIVNGQCAISNPIGE